MKAEVREVLHTECTLGEGALWDAQRKVVWFVDIKKHHLWHYDPATGSNARAVAPDQIGWALPAEGGLLLCGLKEGLWTFDPQHQSFTRLRDEGIPHADLPGLAATTAARPGNRNNPREATPDEIEALFTSIW